MEFKDYYTTLGVAKTASEKEIKQAFRKLARKHHPDVNPGDKAAESKFKEINEAYEVLGDPAKRKKYDELGANWRMYEQAAASGSGSAGPFAGRWNVNAGGSPGGWLSRRCGRRWVGHDFARFLHGIDDDVLGSGRGRADVPEAAISHPIRIDSAADDQTVQRGREHLDRAVVIGRRNRAPGLSKRDSCRKEGKDKNFGNRTDHLGAPGKKNRNRVA